MTSHARQTVLSFVFMIAFVVQSILFGPLIIRNYNDIKKASSLEEPTVTEVARGDYLSNKKQELVILLALVAISANVNVMASLIFGSAKRIEW